MVLSDLDDPRLVEVYQDFVDRAISIAEGADANLRLDETLDGMRSTLVQELARARDRIQMQSYD